MKKQVFENLRSSTQTLVYLAEVFLLAALQHLSLRPSYFHAYKVDSLTIPAFPLFIFISHQM